MNKYFICPIEKITTIEGKDIYFARARRYSGISFAALIPTGADGVPLFNFALVAVGKDIFDSLSADALLDKLPDAASLDSDVSIPADLKTKLIAKFGESVPDTISLRQLVRRIGRRLLQNFDEEKLRAAED